MKVTKDQVAGLKVMWVSMLMKVINIRLVLNDMKIEGHEGEADVVLDRSRSRPRSLKTKRDTNMIIGSYP